MNKRRISFIYKLLVTFCLSIGIALNVIRTTSISAILSYYTLQSNIICLIVFSIFSILELKGIRYQENRYFIVKGAITIAILLTGMIYWIGLVPNGFQMNSILRTDIESIIANMMVHTVSPILVLLDYFLFDLKGKFKLYYPVYWLVIPIAYVIYVYSYSANGGRFFGIGGSRQFAYAFLDYNKIGYIGVAKWIIGILIFILGMSYFLIWIDYKLGARARS